jgi:hypothetical protein
MHRAILALLKGCSSEEALGGLSNAFVWFPSWCVEAEKPRMLVVFPQMPVKKTRGHHERLRSPRDRAPEKEGYARVLAEG